MSNFSTLELASFLEKQHDFYMVFWGKLHESVEWTEKSCRKRQEVEILWEILSGINRKQG